MKYTVKYNTMKVGNVRLQNVTGELYEQYIFGGQWSHYYVNLCGFQSSSRHITDTTLVSKHTDVHIHKIRVSYV